MRTSSSVVRNTICLAAFRICRGCSVAYILHFTMDDDNKQMETFEAEKELPSEFKPQVDIAMIRVKAVAVAVISTNIMCLICSQPNIAAINDEDDIGECQSCGLMQLMSYCRSTTSALETSSKQSMLPTLS